MEDIDHRPPGGRKDVHSHPEDALEADVYDIQDHKIAPHPAAGENTIDSLALGGLKSAGENPTLQHGIEREYDGIGIPPWREQLTVRAIVVSAILGVVFCVITHRLNLTVGVIPSLNVCAGLLGFFFVKIYTTVLRRFGLKVKPFTRQENTVIQTCVVSCYGIAFSGGFGSYLFGMSPLAYEKLGTDTKGNTLQDVKTLQLGWIFGYIFVVSLVGIFALVPLRKIMIIDYKLIYPSGTATALLINSFHTPTGGALAKKQVRCLGKYFSISFLFSMFKWFFGGDQDTCGFDSFPSLGMKAWQNKFYFDFNLTYVGSGMICPHIVNVSVLFGGIVSWGIMWPLIQNNKGKWYPADAGSSDFRGLFGYKVFISIALILGDGLYHFVQVNLITIKAMYIRYKNRQQLPTTNGVEEEDAMSYDEKKRNGIFMKDGVPYWFAVAGYITLSIISIIVIPQIVPSVKWYYVLVAYIIGPVFAFSNAYGAGLTDWSLASNYGKILLFLFATWAGSGGGGILAGLAACGVMMSIVSTASDLMQDFKTGYLTLASPRSMFISQLLGGIMGCIFAPLTFWLYYKAFNVGSPNSIYKAPFAVIYRAMALIGTEGFGSLPTHCLQLCAGWFAFAIVLCFIRDRLPERFSRYLPLPMAMAIPFYLGPYFAIDMFVGTVIKYMWELSNKKKADTFSAAVASGLICGDGLWTIPAAILNFTKIYSPICMAFFPRKVALAAGIPYYSN